MQRTTVGLLVLLAFGMFVGPRATEAQPTGKVYRKGVIMDRKPVSDPALAAQGTFQGTIDRNANFRQQALDHNLGRNILVTKLLGYLALLRQSGASLPGVIACVAAVRQNFSSSQSMTQMGLPTGPTQAAHFLPGQILCGGQELWRFATNLTTRNHIEFLFAAVEHLPVPFNQADTAAEAKGQSGGLCSALVHACTTLIRRQGMFRVPPGKLPLDLVQAAYVDWHQDAMTALRNAVANKGAKPRLPPLVGDRFEGYTPASISARATASTTLWNRDDALRILQYYLEDQQQRTWQWVMGSCQGALREVEWNFKG
jgi:hypothetical protein